MVAFVIGLVPVTRADTIKYVDASISTSGNGDSWSTAYKTLTEAVDAAGSDWVIKVAQGSYSPGTEEEDTFLIDTDGVEIYGGYAGLQGQDPNARDIVDYETILTGVVVVSPSIVRAWHVVKFTSNVGTTTLLDGVTIIACEADRPDEPDPPVSHEADRNGGGIWVEKGEPVISNCTIKNNTADHWGGGVYMQGDFNAAGDDAVFLNCTFDNNTAEANGGGMLVDARIAITDCVFKNNDCTGTQTNSQQENGGGGLWITPGHGTGSNTVVLAGCNFLDNTAITFGGGLAVATATGPAPMLINCQFHENVASDGDSAGVGGGIWSQRPMELINVTLAKNTCSEDNKGGGIFVDTASWQSESLVLMTNCILWGNESTNHNNEADQIHFDDDVQAEVVNTCVEDLETWTDELDLNTAVSPNFKNINSNLIMDGTDCGGGQCISLSIDRGDNGSISASNDIGKRTRKIDRDGDDVVTVDMGCWETQSGE
ncbi:MAG: DUF1565 domain-containing protein [Phycisphaerales bacterium]|nr:DUF1565 domain-containing protein [Phycisphaerales bacterium]